MAGSRCTSISGLQLDRDGWRDYLREAIILKNSVKGEQYFEEGDKSRDGYYSRKYRYLKSFTGRVPSALSSRESGNMFLSVSVIFTPAGPVKFFFIGSILSNPNDRGTGYIHTLTCDLRIRPTAISLCKKSWYCLQPSLQSLLAVFQGNFSLENVNTQNKAMIDMIINCGKSVPSWTFFAVNLFNYKYNCFYRNLTDLFLYAQAQVAKLNYFLTILY